MSLVRSKEKVLAIFCADLHLSLNPPIWRSAEPNWFKAMIRPLDEIKQLQEKYNCPIICAGDIFDRWNSPPEIINFALERLPHMYTIPGQHDLPLHNYEDIRKSAYWTLVEAGKIIHKERVIIKGMEIKFFPFGKKIKSTLLKSASALHIAVSHEYKWIQGCSYSKASKENKIEYRKASRSNDLGYDIIIYGDNHIGFLTKQGKTQIFNCGSLMRIKSDQVNYKPQIGLLLECGKVVSHYLDISKDKYLELENTNIKETLDMKSLIQELEKLDSVDMDFSEVMVHYLKRNKIKKAICNIIIGAMRL